MSTGAGPSAANTLARSADPSGGTSWGAGGAGSGQPAAGISRSMGARVEITSSGSVTDRLHDDWWWYAIWGGLVVAGLIAQISAAGRVGGTMREAWDESKA